MPNKKSMRKFKEQGNKPKVHNTSYCSIYFTDKDGNKQLMGRKRHSDKEIIPIKRKQSPYKKVGHGKTKQVLVFKNTK